MNKILSSKIIKILAISDLHIHNYKMYATFTDNISSRLSVYSNIADYLVSRCRDNNIDLITITGDILNAHKVDPSVLNEARDFLTKLNSLDIPVVLIYGNHDTDSKCLVSENKSLSRLHTPLKTLTHNLKNFIYIDTPRVLSLPINGNNITINAQPWSVETSVIESGETTIFLAHKAIKGLQTSGGYTFVGGLDPVELRRSAILSIIGDTHIQYENTELGRTIVSVGALIQNSFSDSKESGFAEITLNLDAEMVTEVKFHTLAELIPNLLHQFLYTDDPAVIEDNDNELLHYKLKDPKAKKKGEESEPEVVNVQSQSTEDLLSLIPTFIPEKEKADAVLELLTEMIQGNDLTSADVKMPSNVELLSIDIHNYISIGDITLDLSPFQKLNLITGGIGSGKTSLVDAIFWCITGTSCKGSSVKDLIRIGNDDNKVSAKLDLIINSIKYSIYRARENDSPVLMVTQYDADGKGKVISKNSISDTTDLILDLIGVSSTDLFMMSYISSVNPILYSNLTQQDRTKLLSTITNIDFITQLSDIIKAKISVSNKSVIEKGATARVLIETLESKKIELEKLTNDNTSDQVRVELNRLKKQKSEMEDVVKAKTKTLKDIADSQADSLARISKLEASVVEYSNLTNLLAEHKRRSDQFVVKLNSLKTSKNCPTCNQALLDDKLLVATKKEKEAIDTKIKSIDFNITCHSNNNSADTQELSKLKLKQSTEYNAKTQHTELLNNLAKITKAISELEVSSDVVGKISYAEKDIIKLQEKVNTANEDLDSVIISNSTEKTLNSILSSKSDLFKHIVKSGVNLLQVELDYLCKDTPFKAKLDPELLIMSANFDGIKYHKYNNLSRGQRTISDLLMTVAIVNVQSRLHNLDGGILGTLVLDDIISFIDEDSIDYIVLLLSKCISSKLIILSHDQRLLSLVSYRLHVVHNSKYSELKDI